MHGHPRYPIIIDRFSGCRQFQTYRKRLAAEQLLTNVCRLPLSIRIQTVPWPRLQYVEFCKTFSPVIGKDDVPWQISYFHACIFNTADQATLLHASTWSIYRRSFGTGTRIDQCFADGSDVAQLQQLWPLAVRSSRYDEILADPAAFPIPN
jgi:hypothetical protein